MFGCARLHRAMVKSDNFLVIPKRPLVIINWPLSVQWPVSGQAGADVLPHFLRHPRRLARQQARARGRENLSGSSLAR